MPPAYIVTDGAFDGPDGKPVGEGGTIELDEDVARLHPTRLRPAPPTAEAPAGDLERAEQLVHEAQELVEHARHQG